MYCFNKDKVAILSGAMERAMYVLIQLWQSIQVLVQKRRASKNFRLTIIGEHPQKNHQLHQYLGFLRALNYNPTLLSPYASNVSTNQVYVVYAINAKQITTASEYPCTCANTPKTARATRKIASATLALVPKSGT